jgi:hypothetical protein
VFSNAEGSDWKPYAISQSGNYRYFYDAGSTLYHSKDLVRFWSKVLYRTDEGKGKVMSFRKNMGLTTKGYQNIDYTLRYKEINCDKRTHRLLSTYDYDKGGNLLDSVTYSFEAAWKSIVPDSAIEELFIIICPKKSN